MAIGARIDYLLEFLRRRREQRVKRKNNIAGRARSAATRVERSKKNI